MRNASVDVADAAVPMPEGVDGLSVLDDAGFDAAVTRLARVDAGPVGIIVGDADDDTCARVAVLVMMGAVAVRTSDPEHVARVTNVIDALLGRVTVGA